MLVNTGEELALDLQQTLSYQQRTVVLIKETHSEYSAVRYIGYLKCDVDLARANPAWQRNRAIYDKIAPVGHFGSSICGLECLSEAIG
jgi:hypothetical protein